ncbi:MAG: cyclic-di-AMP receptor [Chloroflexota bacterium]
MSNSDNMKLIIIVANDSECENLLKALLEADFRVTRVASSGGFLRRGNSTLLMGVKSERVKEAIQMVRKHNPPGIEQGLKKVTVFVLKVEKFVQL